MKKQHKHIDWNIFSKVAEGKSTVEEQNTVDQWMAIDEARKNYFIKAVRYYQNQDNDTMRPIKNPEEAFNDFITAIARKQLRPYRHWAIAASIAIVIGASWMGYSLFQDQDYQTLAELPQIAANAGQIELVLSDGERVLLNQQGQQNIVEGKHKIAKTNGSINYLDYKGDAKKRLRYNTIKVPRGTNFKVILSDSTKVWLNAESSITYPVHFAQNQRRLRIEGEAYFDVTPDKDRPFVVDVAESQIEVLGTEFNINAHQGHQEVITTLIEGSVRVKNTFGQTAIIKPGEQARCGLSPAISIRQVTSEYITDWHEGLFQFEDETLENILTDMARWYDYEIFYEDENIKQLRFTGKLSRDNNMNDLLELLELTRSIKFYIKDHSILVKEN